MRSFSRLKTLEQEYISLRKRKGQINKHNKFIIFVQMIYAEFVISYYYQYTNVVFLKIYNAQNNCIIILIHPSNKRIHFYTGVF